MLCHLSLLVRRFLECLLGPAPLVLELEVDGCGLHPPTLKLKRKQRGVKFTKLGVLCVVHTSVVS